MPSPPPAPSTWRPASTSSYDAGSKLVTIAFANGPVLTQQANPQHPSLRDLVVTGTAGDDHIQFTPAGGGIQVQVDAVPNGRFAPTGRLVAHGQADNEHIQVDKALTLPAFLFGGNGANVHIEGGGGPTRGGGRHRRQQPPARRQWPEYPHRRPGRRPSRGEWQRRRPDRGGTTNYDHNLVALEAILAEWNSARRYADRVANLSGTGNGPRANGDVFLKASGPDATVFDDGAVNWLQGASGMNWYFAKRSGGVRDIINGLGDSEVVEDLDPEAGVQSPTAPLGSPGATGARPGRPCPPGWRRPSPTCTGAGPGPTT